MPSETSPFLSPASSPLKRGVYSAPSASDIRGPCPLVNCLSNHGLIARDGRAVHASELTAALRSVGISIGLGAIFSYPIFGEHTTDPSAAPPRSFLASAWNFLRHPLAALYARFGMRRKGQVDAMGEWCLDLDQLALPGVVEHDISLTRYDHQQGNNLSKQPDLVQDLLASSSDGGKTLTARDLAALRRRRIERQRETNPGAKYGSIEHSVACAEIALVLGVFGDGKKVRADFAKAVFAEERLPEAEGWKTRKWWKMGILELGLSQTWIGRLIGVKV